MLAVQRTSCSPRRNGACRDSSKRFSGRSCLLRACSRAEHDEFVSAQTAHNRVCGGCARESPSHFNEDAVPDSMPETIVDLLEAVKVCEQQNDLSAAGSPQPFVERVPQLQTIAESGECVLEHGSLEPVVCLVPKPLA